MIDPTEIAYIDEPDLDYCKGLDKARVPAELKALTVEYKKLFPDAHEQAQGMSDEDFMEWRRGLKKERKGTFAGEPFMEKFGAILMPANMLHVGMIKNQFKVPFGLAFRRLVEAELMKIQDGVAVHVANAELDIRRSNDAL